MAILATAVCIAATSAYGQVTSAAGATGAPAAQSLAITMGRQLELTFPQGVRRIELADEQVVAVHVLRTSPGKSAARILISPLRPGTTHLRVWGPDETSQHYELHVQQQVQVLQGSVESVDSLVQRQAVAQAQQADKPSMVNLGTVQAPSQAVQVDVKVVEFNRTQLQQAGIHLFSTRPNSHGFSFGVLSAGNASGRSFDGNGQLTGPPGSPLSQAFGLLMNFGNGRNGLNLSLLEGNGLGRVLAAPTLVALSGQSARFLSGGEIPVPVSQGNGSINIEYKPYGIGLTVSPTVLDSQRIVLKVAPEASELDHANAVMLQGTSVPAISTRKADTTVELGDGESFVIGGLVSQNTTSTVDKVPVLGDIPVVGTLFKRQEFLRKDRELVIVVTPHLVRPLRREASLDAALPGADLADHGQGFWNQYLGTSPAAAGSAVVPVMPGFSP